MRLYLDSNVWDLRPRSARPRTEPKGRVILELEHQVGEGRVEVTHVVGLTLGRAGRSMGARPALLPPHIPAAEVAAGVVVPGCRY